MAKIYALLANHLFPYFQRRLVIILLLGFVSGLPLLLSFGTLSAWLREAGVDRSSSSINYARSKIPEESFLLNKQPLLSLLVNHYQEKEKCYQFDEPSRQNINLLLDLSNRRLTSSLMLDACLFRCESRGGHFRTDFPIALPQWACHSRQKLGEGLFTRPVRD